MTFSEIKELCSTLRQAQNRTWSEAAWKAVHNAIVEMVVACRARDADGVAAWLEARTGTALFVCRDCDRWSDKEKSIIADDEWVCHFCRENYSVCEECDCLTHDDYGHSINGGSRWCCDSCLEYYRTCSECDYEGHRENMFRSDGDWYCEDHVPSEDDDYDRSSLINAYDADILEVLSPVAWLAAPSENTDRHGNGKAKISTLWMGFELEVVARKDRQGAAEAVKAGLCGRGILKYDGSIPENGFEIVSLPATLAYHQTQWDESFFSMLFAHVRGWREPSCGMHVHLSRDALTPLQIARLQVFINGDGKHINNKLFIEKVAGRGATAHSAQHNKRLTDSAPMIERHEPASLPYFVTDCQCPPCIIQREAYQRALAASKGSEATAYRYRQLSRNHDGHLSRACHDRTYADRYQAVNLQNNRTVEIRIFQSNIAKVGFLKNIEFCHAAAKFCADAGNNGLHAANFLSWLDNRRGEYPNLVRWAVREDLMTRRHFDPPGTTLPAIAA